MSIYQFGPFQLDSAERLLRKGDRPIPLTPKAFDTLVLLVQNQGRLLDKDTILRTIWPDTFVEEATLAQNIFTLRKALGETNGGSHFIETVPKRGYRFVGQVHEIHRDDELSSARVAAPPWTTPIRRKQAVFIVASAILVLTVSSGWLLTRMREPGASVAPPARSIAVLPFKSLSNDLTDEYLGLAMADALITKLGNIRQVIVRPTTAVRKYAKPQNEPVNAGRELGVESVLDGNIQRSGDRVRVSVQLFRVRDGASIWGSTFDVPSADIFTLQDRVSEQVAQAMMMNVAENSAPAAIKRHTENARAYEAYLKGRYFWNKRTAPGHQRAIQHFEAAIREDPQFALAYSGLADAYALLASMPNETVPRSVGMPRAREAALKALQLDPNLAEAHTSLAFIKMHYEWDFPAAEHEFKKALELNPGYATAHHWYAYYLMAMMRVDEALEKIRQAQQLDPLSLVICTDVAEMLFFAHRYGESMEQLKKTLEMDPDFPLARRMMAINLAAMGDHKGSLREVERSVASGRQDDLWRLVGIHLTLGERDKALQLLSKLGKKKMYNLNLEVAGIYLQLGDEKRFWELMEEAYRERNGGLILLNVTDWGTLKNDPRMKNLIRRVGLAG